MESGPDGGDFSHRRERPEGVYGKSSTHLSRHRLDLSDDELEAPTRHRLLNPTLDNDRFPLAPRRLRAEKSRKPLI